MYGKKAFTKVLEAFLRKYQSISFKSGKTCTLKSFAYGLTFIDTFFPSKLSFFHNLLFLSILSYLPECRHKKIATDNQKIFV